MELKNVNILEANFLLKKIKISYYDNLVGQNRTADETDYPHPDLIKARDELREDLAKAYRVEDRDSEESFTVNGFTIDEGDGITTITIKGQMMNPYEYLTKVESGKIPLDEDQEDLKLKLETLKLELFNFIFEAKTSQGKLEDFPATSQQEKEMKDKEPSDEGDMFDNPSENEPAPTTPEEAPA